MTDPTASHQILGLDNVALDLSLAGLGSRLLAMFIDLVIVGLLALLLTVALVLTADAAGVPGDWIVVLVMFLLFFLQWAYFSVCELTMDGRTPGKSLIGLRAVSSLGGRPSAGAVLVRNLLRLIDLLFGWPLIALDPKNRRLGDLLAATLVVHHRGDEHGLRLGNVPPSWGSREVAVVESFLRRAPRMEVARARQLAERLLDWLRRREPSYVADHRDGLADHGSDPVAELASLLRAESV